MKRHLSYRLSQFLHTNFCVLDVRPLQPNTIDKDTINIPVFEISNTTNINLTISWMHPTTTYGLITAYEVIVTKDPLIGQIDVMSSASVIYTSSGTLTASVSCNNRLYCCKRLSIIVKDAAKCYS